MRPVYLYLHSYLTRSYLLQPDKLVAGCHPGQARLPEQYGRGSVERSGFQVHRCVQESYGELHPDIAAGLKPAAISAGVMAGAAGAWSAFKGYV